MKKIKDKKIIVLALILIIFTFSYFIIVNKISYAFDENYDFSVAAQKKENIIIKCAEKYGKEKKDSFNEEGIIYITVQNLIDDGCLFPSAEGKIFDLKNPKETLNDNKIRIKQENGRITVELYN